MARVFISYSSEDAKFVDDLVRKLSLRNVDVWYAKNEIKVGDSIVRKITNAIQASDWLLIVLSKSSIKSRWVQQELNSALAIAVQREAYILPVLIDTIEMPSLLVDRKYADFTRDPEQAFQDLLAVVAPGIASFSDERSQIIWGILTGWFVGYMESSAGSTPQEAMAEMGGRFSGLKEKWGLSDDVYGLYIEMCLDSKKLLAMVEFINKLPDFLKKDDPRTSAVVAFLLKEALGPEGPQIK